MQDNLLTTNIVTRPDWTQEKCAKGSVKSETYTLYVNRTIGTVLETKFIAILQHRAPLTTYLLLFLHDTPYLFTGQMQTITGQLQNTIQVIIKHDKPLPLPLPSSICNQWDGNTYKYTYLNTYDWDFPPWYEKECSMVSQKLNSICCENGKWIAANCKWCSQPYEWGRLVRQIRYCK